MYSQFCDELADAGHLDIEGTGGYYTLGLVGGEGGHYRQMAKHMAEVPHGGLGDGWGIQV